MRTEILVDKEHLQGQIKNVSEIIYFIENGGIYEVKDKNITLIYEDGTTEKEISYLDLTEVQSRYPDIELQTVTIGGVTFVTAGEYLVDCGIVKEPSDMVTEIAVSATNADITQWAVEAFDEYNNTKYSNGVWKAAKTFWLSVCINDTFTDTGIDYDELVNMGEEYAGGLAEYSIGYLANYAFRDQCGIG